MRNQRKSLATANVILQILFYYNSILSFWDHVIIWGLIWETSDQLTLVGLKLHNKVHKLAQLHDAIYIVKPWRPPHVHICDP